MDTRKPRGQQPRGFPIGAPVGVAVHTHRALHGTLLRDARATHGFRPLLTRPVAFECSELHQHATGELIDRSGGVYLFRGRA
ncbi:hypothetical protein [Nonomuraea jabiensis]|uniref:hypothetical protein n=1 Tax=Nonomuraea jabiensis TaxID=882448 RepID=UPI003D76528C